MDSHDAQNRVATTASAAANPVAMAAAPSVELLVLLGDGLGLV